MSCIRFTDLQKIWVFYSEIHLVKFHIAYWLLHVYICSFILWVYFFIRSLCHFDVAFFFNPSTQTHTVLKFQIAGIFSTEKLRRKENVKEMRMKSRSSSCIVENASRAPFYVGERVWTIKLGLWERMTIKTSHVHKHLSTHGDNPSLNGIRCWILHTGFRHTGIQITLEVIEIGSLVPYLSILCASWLLQRCE